MKWVQIANVTWILALIVLYEWPKIDKTLKREKRAFIILCVIAYGFSFLLVLFPNLYSPVKVLLTLHKS